MYAPRSRAAAGATNAAPHWIFYDVYQIITSFLCAAGSNLALACGSPLLRSSAAGLCRPDRRRDAIATPSPSQILRGRRNPRLTPAALWQQVQGISAFPPALGPRADPAAPWRTSSHRWDSLPTLPRLGCAAHPSSRNGSASVAPRELRLSPIRANRHDPCVAAQSTPLQESPTAAPFPARQPLSQLPRRRVGGAKKWRIAVSPRVWQRGAMQSSTRNR